MNHPIGSGTRCDGDKRRQRQHVPGRVTHLQAADGFGLHAVVRIGLGSHLVGAAEPVEVVDVQRTEVDLQRLEHIRQSHPLALDLGAVDIDIQLGRVDVQTGHQPGDLARLGGFCHQHLGVLHQSLEPDPATVLNLQFEASGHSKAGHWRRWEYAEETVGNARELGLQAPGDGHRSHVGRSTLLERIEHDEHYGSIGYVNEAVDRQPRERHHTFDSRLIQGDFRHLPHHRIGTIQGGRIGQLGDAYQVVLVLHRHEARRYSAEAEPGQRQQAAIDQQRRPATARYLAHRVAIRLRCPLERPAQHLHQVRGATAQATRVMHHRSVARAQQQAGECRAEGQGVDRRQDRGNRDGQRELPIELTLQATEEGGGDEHRSEYRGDRNDRPGDLAHRSPRSLRRLLAVLDMPLDVLDHHDCIVDHNPDGQDQAEQRQGIEGEAHQMHDRKGADDRHRHGHQRDQRRTPVTQEHHHHEDHQQDRFHQGDGH